MSNHKTIGMILERDFPPDDRPEKEALSLIQAGYQVHMLCFTWSNKPLQELYKGIKITRFRINKTLYRKLSPTYLALPFYRILWKKHIKSFVKNNSIDIIHLHDLPMTDLVLEIAEKQNCKVVCDQHEYWSSWITNTAHYNTFLGKIVKKLSNWERYEKTHLQKADLVITVTDPLKQCYIDEVGIDPNKIVTTPNTPSISVFKHENVNQDVVNNYKEKFVLFYAGAIDILRGLDVTIKALKEIEKSVPNVLFLVAGRFSKNCNILEMAKENGVSHLVEFVGWISVENLPTYIAASDVCLFTPYANHKEINNTIATKIYQYLAMAKPIITSKAKMMKTFILNNKLGFSIDPHDPSDFAKQIIDLKNNYEKFSVEIQKNSEKLINTSNIFWDQTVKDLLRAYSTL